MRAPVSHQLSIMNFEQLFLISCADIFAIYPRVLRELLVVEELERSLSSATPHSLIIRLPSDVEWQCKQYYRLLEAQRKINQAIDRGEVPIEINHRVEKQVWDPVWNDFRNIPTPSSGSSKLMVCRKSSSSSSTSVGSGHTPGTFWTIEDYAKAGKLLHRPPIPCDFRDEQDMRKVYSLIYDVFRYKVVLTQALNDISFFATNPEFVDDQTRVWLLLFDLHARHFVDYEPVEATLKRNLFAESYLGDIDRHLWSQRTKLAAALSRLRIQNSALRLCQLLPLHLQDERVAIAAANPLVTGWINPFRLKTRTAATECLLAFGLHEVQPTTTTSTVLHANEFEFDSTCPLLLHAWPAQRSAFLQDELVREHQFIMQDKAFALGAALFCRLLDHFEMDGNVVQTHVSSPRATAYLACLFNSQVRVFKFYAFGAGVRLHEYRQYMNALGIDERYVHVCAENFCDLTIDSQLMDKVVGIFATPPNSYSGVTDPIDLICSRGGDLSMLEVLTESELSVHGRKRVAQVLDEQRETLRQAMSRPQVQFVLYETHSVVDTENGDMVRRSIEAINLCARDKHAAVLCEKMLSEAEAAATIGENQSSGSPQTSAHKLKQKALEVVRNNSMRKRKQQPAPAPSTIATTDDKESVAKKGAGAHQPAEICGSGSSVSFIVPDTDVFEHARIPDICLNQDNCVHYPDYGCFVALLKRKQVTRLDSTYLIRMAEERGLFASTAPKKPKLKATRKQGDENDQGADGGGGGSAAANAATKLKRKKSDLSVLIDRLSRPTHSFMNHVHRERRSLAETKFIRDDEQRCECMRHQNHHRQQLQQQLQQQQQWWRESAAYVQSLRTRFKTAATDFNHIFHAIRTGQVAPLKLRRANGGGGGGSSERCAHGHKLPYPVAINLLEFCEHVPSPNRPAETDDHRRRRRLVDAKRS